MSDEDRRQSEARQRRLMTLLLPLHDGARATARRLCACAADGDDLFQEAVLRAFDRISDLRDETRFRSWFYAVLLSTHRARRRRSFWRRLLPLDEVVARGAEPSVDGGAAASDGAARMSAALATLPVKARESIVLFELDGFSLEEIAGLQGQSISAVKSRLVRARARLRRFYEEQEATAAQPAVASEGESS